MTPSALEEQMEVIVLPGLDGTGELSRPFAGSPPAGFASRVIAYPRHRRHSIDELVVLVTQQLPSQPCVLVAESFSGAVAIRLAASHPHRLLALALVATAAKWSRVRLFRSLRLTPIFSIRPPGSLLRWLFIGTDASDEQVQITRRAIASVDPSVLANRLRDLASTDVRNQLRELRVPTLYLQGRRDRLARRFERQSVVGALPSTRCDLVDGPHCLLLTRPQQVWEHLIDFVRSCRAR